MIERLQSLIEGLENMVRHVEAEGSETKARVQRIEEKLKSAEFAESFVTVANIAIFTANIDRVRQFGEILGYEATSADPKGWDEAATLVSDFSRLTDTDVLILREMVRFQGHAVSDSPTPQEYNALDESFVKVVQATAAQRVPVGDLYSRALRLTAFGLARTLNWNQTRWAPQDMVFAPTPRGKRLIRIMDAGSSTFG